MAARGRDLSLKGKLQDSTPLKHVVRIPNELVERLIRPPTKKLQRILPVNNMAIRGRGQFSLCSSVLSYETQN